MCENVYLVQLIEHVKNGEQVFKVGRTRNMQKRMNGYPKGSIVLKTCSCYHSVKVEHHLIALFHQQFKHLPEYGAEYFSGDPNQMITTIEKAVTNEKTAMAAYLNPPTRTAPDPAKNPLIQKLKLVNFNQFLYNPNQ